MPIRWDKFTVKAQEAVQRANELASEHGNPELLPLHLLAALLEDKEGIVPPVLEKIGIGPQAVLAEVYRELEKLPKVSGQRRSGHNVERVEQTAGAGLQGSLQLQRRIRLHRAPAAGHHAPQARRRAANPRPSLARPTMQF